ncbi:hypothetical protein MNQ98_26300 [Paenibacillus sp. N3/727]|uniref:hypothetical protein n=1 Tax=Paenibacillus sp. N3/727 TaxID=2925845 RepID=UPI001F539132|nr:hypothetical protein [Paenibacillus sp. N3/727]UNK17904.1 hypothetical protein MNQ98_26300 [Paenibacillus sp. N3/727]
MKIHTYHLGIFPLDWEVCFLTVEEYKQKLAEKYQQSKQYCDFIIGGLNILYDKIDEILNFAMDDFKKYSPYTELRCPPMIFPMPRGDSSNGADFVIILKLDEDGDTIVYSPFPLPHLEQD